MTTPILSAEAKVFIERQHNSIQIWISEPEVVAPNGCENCKGLGYSSLSALQPVAPGALDGNIISRNGSNYRILQTSSFRCPICSEGHGKAALLLNGNGVPGPEKTYRIGFYKNMEGKTIAHKMAQKVLSDAPGVNGFNLLFGDNGMGKSGISKAIINQLSLVRVNAQYVNASSILSRIRATFQNRIWETEESIIDEYAKIRALAIDEIDVIASTDWSLSTLRAILDKRYTLRETKLTLVITNAMPDELWPYLASRCKDGQRILMAGKELRGSN